MEEQVAWQIGRFDEREVPELVQFWNSEFASWRMFRPLTEDWFRIRVMGRATFDPSGFYIARAGGSIVGLGHAAKSGTEAYVSLLYVVPGHRRQGIGTALISCLQPVLDSARETRAAAVVLDPVYGTGFDVQGSKGLRCRPQWGGPRLSLFGSCEGIGVPARDLETVNFLLKRGFRMGDPDLSMRLEGMRPGEFGEPRNLRVRGRRFDIRIHENRSPWGAEGYQWEVPHRCVQLLAGDKPVGGLTWCHWDDSTAILYDFSLMEQVRGLGFGRAVLSHALADMAQAGCTACELNTGSSRNARAVGIYRAAGFRIAEAWQTFHGQGR
jgi:ribosomal protein S18 acetylase RimI-like enzyme